MIKYLIESKLTENQTFAFTEDLCQSPTKQMKILLKILFRLQSSWILNQEVCILGFQ